MDDSRAAFPASCRHQGIQGAKGGRIGTQIGFQYPVNVAVAQLFQPREGSMNPALLISTSTETPRLARSAEKIRPCGAIRYVKRPTGVGTVRRFPDCGACRFQPFRTAVCGDDMAPPPMDRALCQRQSQPAASACNDHVFPVSQLLFMMHTSGRLICGCRLM